MVELAYRAPDTLGAWAWTPPGASRRYELPVVSGQLPEKETILHLLVPKLPPRARSQVALRKAWGKPHPTVELYFASEKDVKDLNDLKDQKDKEEKRRVMLRRGHRS
jgi:hypothetical protein